MSRKHKQKHKLRPTVSLDVLRARVERAVQEDRYQFALELGKQLYKQEPTPAHRDLLEKVYLGRARQLRKQGYTRDARAVLENAILLAGSDPNRLEPLAEELAACGEVRRALDLLAQLPTSQAQSRVLAQAADAAVEQGPAGRAQLPQALQEAFDRVRQAAAQIEAGQSEPARETLQGIGLQSPFLDWKVFLRGLAAYYQNDDPRAIENWQRLNPDRLPARLAAPLRFLIDAAYRQAQPPEMQAVLQRQAERLRPAGLVESLRGLQAALADAEQLPRAFRLAEKLLPDLRRQAPALVPRLAACFYWAVVSHGEAEDVLRYERAFGAPADDPHLARLRALLFENLFEMQKAHTYWQEFEQAVARNPAAWPGEQADRVRALVWCRMGHNAANVPDADQIPNLPPFLRDFPGRPRPLKPSAEKCFQRSLELAPDQLETYEALYDYYKHQNEPARAEQAGRQLLERFPDHVPMLEELAGLRSRLGDYAEAVALLERALKHNPLDRSLRQRVGTAHLFSARSHAEAGRFDTARTEYQTALAYSQGRDEATVYCKWAACEFKAGDAARAEELLQKALADAGSRLAVAYSMLIEAARLRLAGLKKRFNKEFNDGLAAPPTGVAATAMAVTASAHQQAGVRYHGQKTHEKKVLTYLGKALGAEFTEEQLQKTCLALLDLEAYKLLHDYTARGRQEFPHNPYFYFLEAESYFALGPFRCPAWKVQPLLTKARELAAQLPPDARQKALLETIGQRQQLLGASSFLSGPQAMGMFGDVFEQLFGSGFADEEPDFDDEY